jgi:hypothetical protein
MKLSLWKVLIALIAFSRASAALVDFRLQYDRIDLKNGKTLQGVTLKSYDSVTGKVGAVAGRSLLTIRIVDLPDSIAARVKELVPPLSEEEMKAEKRKAEDDLKAAKRRNQYLEKSARNDAKANRDAQRKLDVKRAEVTIEKQGKSEADIIAAAKGMAEHYFRYEADPNSSRGYTFDSSVLLGDPEPVPGWTNRWRVRGKVGIQYLTRNIGAVGRSSKDFEMLIDVSADGKPKLVEITESR